MRTGKILAAVALSVLLIPTAAALNVGSFPSKKNVDLAEGETARFELSFFNLGDKPVTVELQDKSDLEMSFPAGRNVTLEPSEMVNAPKGEGEWYAVPGRGAYVRTETLPVEIQAPDNIGFTGEKKVSAVVGADIQPVEDGDGKIYHRLAQSRDFSFDLHVEKRNASGAGDRASTRSENGGTGKDVTGGTGEGTGDSTGAGVSIQDGRKVPEDGRIEGEGKTGGTAGELQTEVSKAEQPDALPPERRGAAVTGRVTGRVTENASTTAAIWLLTATVLLAMYRRRRY